MCFIAGILLSKYWQMPENHDSPEVKSFKVKYSSPGKIRFRAAEAPAESVFRNSPGNMQGYSGQAGD